MIPFVVHNCVVDNKSNGSSSFGSLRLLKKAALPTLNQSHFARDILVRYSAAVRRRKVHKLNIMQCRNSSCWSKNTMRNCYIKTSGCPQNNIIVCITRAFSQVLGCGCG